LHHENRKGTNPDLIEFDKGSIELNYLSIGISRSDTLKIVDAILEGARNTYCNL